jgi:hypothetical protein
MVQMSDPGPQTSWCLGNNLEKALAAASRTALNAPSNLLGFGALRFKRSVVPFHEPN